MNRYAATGFRSVLAESAEAAASVFFARLARAQYGRRRGAVVSLRLCSWVDAGQSYEFGAFIGTYDRASRTYSGRNATIFVHRLTQSDS